MENLDDNTEKIDQGISSHARNELRKGAGWVKAVAILGFIGAGFMLLAAIGMFLLVPVGGILYIIMAGAYGYLSYLLITKAQAASNANFNMDKFAETFHTFWKTSVIISIALVVLGLIFSVIMGATAGSGLSRF